MFLLKNSSNRSENSECQLAFWLACLTLIGCLTLVIIFPSETRINNALTVFAAAYSTLAIALVTGRS